jgi:hypothetical protein
MRCSRPTWIAAVLLLSCSFCIGSASAAWGSESSIKAVILSYAGKIDIVEGRVVTAVGEFRETKNVAPLETAISGSVSVLRTLQAKLSRQGAHSTRVKKAKAKIVGGLRDLVVAYEELAAVYNEYLTNPTSARSTALSAQGLVVEGRNEVIQGIKLLH